MWIDPVLFWMILLSACIFSVGFAFGVLVGNNNARRK